MVTTCRVSTPPAPSIWYHYLSMVVFTECTAAVWGSEGAGCSGGAEDSQGQSQWGSGSWMDGEDSARIWRLHQTRPGSCQETDDGSCRKCQLHPEAVCFSFIYIYDIHLFILALLANAYMVVLVLLYFQSLTAVFWLMSTSLQCLRTFKMLSLLLAN